MGTQRTQRKDAKANGAPVGSFAPALGLNPAVSETAATGRGTTLLGGGFCAR